MTIDCDITSLKQGFQPVDVNDRRIINVLNNVEPQMNDRIDSTNLFRVETIQSAEMIEDGQHNQIRCSILYGETECNKTEIYHIYTCKFTGHHIRCNVHIMNWRRDILEHFDCYQH